MTTENTMFMKGMDISFLPEELDGGMRVYDVDGTPMEPFALLKKYGVNSIRLRIWVNPDNEPLSRGYCSLEHTLKMAKQVVDNGMDFVLDFHYSDWWADPGKQKKPKDWEGLTREELEEKVYSYTRETLLAFEAQGTLPNMVQIGNEIRSGLIFPEGELPDYDGMVRLINAGIRGARSVAEADRMRVMIHLDQGGRYIWLHKWFEGAFAAGLLDFDVIGLSYYPFWHGTYLDIKASMEQLIEDYHKPIMIVETAYAWRKSTEGFIDEEQIRIAGLQANPEGQRQNLELVMYLLSNLPDNMGQGMYYWEPICVPKPDMGGWSENMGLLDENGKAMEGIQAFAMTVEEMRREPEIWPKLKEKLLSVCGENDEFTQGENLLSNGDFFHFEKDWSMTASGAEVTWEFSEGEPGSTSKTLTVESQKNFSFLLETEVPAKESGKYVLTASAKGVDTTGVDVRLFAEANGKRYETMIHPVDNWTGYRLEFDVEVLAVNVAETESVSTAAANGNQLSESNGNIKVGIAITSPPIFLSMRYFKLSHDSHIE